MRPLLSSHNESSQGELSRHEKRPRITGRAIFLSLMLAVFFGRISPLIDYKLSNTYLGASHLPPGALAALLILIAFNGALYFLAPRLAPHLRLAREELLTVFITGLFSCLVPGRGGENFFVSVIVGPFYYATPENRWMQFLAPHLQPWFTPALKPGGGYDSKLVEAFFNGGTTVPWSFWLIPLLCWSVFIFALYVMLACLAVMLRAQWAEHEALAFPLLRLPLEMTDSAAKLPFFRNSLTWIGFGIAVGIQLLNGLNYYFPEVPNVPLLLDSSPYFSEPPLNQVGPLVFRVLPIAVGISYLLNSEIALSFWVFYLLHKSEYVIAYQLGFPPAALPEPIWTRGFSKAFISFQQIGAFWTYALIVLWIARAHLLHVVKRAFDRVPARANEAIEPLSYPVAFWGFVVASLFVLGWTIAAGVHPLLALAMWMTYFVIVVCLTRVVVEGGFLYINHGWSPLLPLANLFGTGAAWFAPHSAVPAALIQGATMIDLKGLILPSFLQGFKLAHDQNIPLRPLLFLIAACIAISFLVGISTSLRLAYETGGLQMNSWFAKVGVQDPARNAKELLGGAQPALAANWFWLGVGSLVTWLLFMARARFAWFPLHPLGYLMWSPYVMYAMWFSIFLGWLAKMLILRFGGGETYRRLMPLFLGLALGDVSMMLFWNAVDLWQGRTGHQLMPG